MSAAAASNDRNATASPPGRGEGRKPVRRSRARRWTPDRLLTFIQQTPESHSVAYLRPFEKLNDERNRSISQKIEANILSMANLDGGVILIGVDKRKPGFKLAPIKAALGEACLSEMLANLNEAARPAKPDFKIRRVSLSREKQSELVYVIEVAKSAVKHYLVASEGLFYPIRSGTELNKLEIVAAQTDEIAIDTDLNDFMSFLAAFILPMFPGAYLDKRVLGSPSASIATLDEEHHRILVKPSKTYSMRLVIARPHPFGSEDREIVKSLIQEAYHAENTVAPEYRNALRSAAIEIALCKYISPESYTTIAQVLNGLTAWSIRTYEGRSSTFGLKLNLQQAAQSSEGAPIEQIISTDYFAVLSDGYETLIEINARGQVLAHHALQAKRVNQNVLAPLPFSGMAEEAGPGQVVIVLTQHLELLIFMDRELKFARRRGVWLHFNHAPIIKLIAGGSRHVSERLRVALYETLLDISFTKTGGTICICRKQSVRRLSEDRAVSGEDLFGHEDQSDKSRFLQQIVQNRKFQELPRSLRKELLSVDGATLVDSDGRVLCVGAIIKVRSGSSAGGRLAATQALAKYGPAFKVSSDGMVSAYHAPFRKIAGPGLEPGLPAGSERHLETLFTIA